MLNEDKELPWCEACWASLRRQNVPLMALANGLLGGRAYPLLQDISFGTRLALRRGRANVRKVYNYVISCRRWVVDGGDEAPEDVRIGAGVGGEAKLELSSAKTEWLKSCRVGGCRVGG